MLVNSYRISSVNLLIIWELFYFFIFLFTGKDSYFFHPNL